MTEEHGFCGVAQSRVDYAYELLKVWFSSLNCPDLV